MWIPSSLARSLLIRFVVAAVACALALAALATIAAWIEGRAPTVQTLRQVVLPLAGALAAGWTLAEWRFHRGDVALAALGTPPARVVALLALLAAPALAAAPAAVATPTPLRVEPSSIAWHGPDGATRWRWAGATVSRTDPDGTTTPLPAVALPAPTDAIGPRAASSPLTAFALRVFALTLALVGLTVGPVPGPARLLLTAGAAFGLGHVLAVLVG